MHKNTSARSALSARTVVVSVVCDTVLEKSKVASRLAILLSMCPAPVDVAFLADFDIPDPPKSLGTLTGGGNPVPVGEKKSESRITLSAFFRLGGVRKAE